MEVQPRLIDAGNEACIILASVMLKILRNFAMKSSLHQTFFKMLLIQIRNCTESQIKHKLSLRQVMLKIQTRLLKTMKHKSSLHQLYSKFYAFSQLKIKIILAPSIFLNYSHTKWQLVEFWTTLKTDAWMFVARITWKNSLLDIFKHEK